MSMDHEPPLNPPDDPMCARCGVEQERMGHYCSEECEEEDETDIIDNHESKLRMQRP